MKKIGILTFHKSLNYGSVLQAWALQSLLVSYGYDVEVIDYEPKEYHQIYGIFSGKGIKRKLNTALVYVLLRKRQDAFGHFRSEHLRLSPEKYFYDSDFPALNAYDVVICGSDQIWNLRAYDCDPVYFLPFPLQGRKLAYAVSTNSTTFSEQRADRQLKEAMLDFDYISEREISGARKIEQFLDCKKKVEVCLDPTLLHGRADYEVITAKRLIRQPYIFLYSVWSAEDGIQAAVTLAKRLGLPVYTEYMSYSPKKMMSMCAQGVRIVITHTSPSDFLSLIKNAEWVVTDSFHGTAFSLIFGKKLMVVNDRQEGGSLKNDERLVNILNEFDLSDRLIPASQVGTIDIFKQIDYKYVEDRREELARLSVRILCNAIEGENS